MPKYLSTRMKIIDSIILIIIVSLVIYFLIIHHRQMQFAVRFKEVPAINNNLFLYRINVHYRGYDVGDVKKIRLSDDREYIEFYVDIHVKNLKIPKNSKITFSTQNIVGTRYLNITPPKKPSKELLKNGDVIEGIEADERFDQYMIEEMKQGKTGNLVKNLYEITILLRKSLEDKENEKLINQSAGDLAIILESLKEITKDPAVKKDIKSAIKHSSSSLESIDEILQKKEVRKSIEESPESINTTLETIKSINESMQKVSVSLPETAQNVAAANCLITAANKNLSSINNKVPPIPQSVINNADQLLIKTDCFETEISKLLSKRALFLRLIFGNPGKSFNKCAKDKCACPTNITKD